MLTSFSNLTIQSDLALATASGTITVTGDSQHSDGLHIRCSSPGVFRQLLKTVKKQGISALAANRLLRKLPSSGQNLRLTVADREIFRIQDQKLTIQYTRLLPYAGTLLFG